MPSGFLDTESMDIMHHDDTTGHDTSRDTESDGPFLMVMVGDRMVPMALPEAMGLSAYNFEDWKYDDSDNDGGLDVWQYHPPNDSYWSSFRMLRRRVRQGW